MPERPPVLTFDQMLEPIEPRVLRALTKYVDEYPDAFENDARAAYASGQLPAEVKTNLLRFVHSEQRKAPRVLDREQLGTYAAGIALAHLWQAENNAARQKHHQLPH